MKKLFVAATVFGVLVVVGWGYWSAMSEVRRWLLFNETTAQKHADALLSGTMPNTPNDLIDTQISTYPGWVLFSSHTDGHRVILAYAPAKRPEPLSVDGAVYQWNQLNEHWYVLEHH